MKVLKKYLIPCLGVFFIVLIYLFVKQPKWTGFYYQKPIVLDIRKPTVRSRISQFRTLQECDMWALGLASEMNGKYDLYYCAKNCSNTWGDIDCLDKTGVLTSFK